MRGASIPLGIFFGVELRLHAYTVMLLPILALLSVVDEHTVGRGLALFLLVLLAIVVRESARVLGRLYAGEPVTQLVLTPIGALPEPGASTATPPRWLALLGPLANFTTSIVLVMLAFSVSSGINFFARPLAGPGHLLRAAVWLQVMLGALHLLPASPLDAGSFLRSQFIRARGEEKGARSAAGLSQAIGLGVILLGGLSQETVLMLLGGTVLLLSQLETRRALAQSAASHLVVGDIMLSEWSSVSASDTVHDALERSTHSLQDAFPVVRGPVIVGSVTRGRLLGALRSEGNGYVQGNMSRDLLVASPDDPLIATMQRAATSGSPANILPVVKDGQVVGILTPTMMSLGSTRRQLVRTRPARDEQRDV